MIVKFQPHIPDIPQVAASETGDTDNRYFTTKQITKVEQIKNKFYLNASNFVATQPTNQIYLFSLLQNLLLFSLIRTFDKILSLDKTN